MNGDRGTLIGAVRGPIMLIALGTLLVFDHMGQYGFSRTWPVLIIVFGVLKLFERTSRPRQWQPSTGGNPPGGNVS